jgi:transcription initiation factor IIE alpha subunit
MKIETKVKRIKQRLRKLHEDLSALQEECEHPNKNKKYMCNNGYDSTKDDSFWVEFKCPDCGKFWTEDQ